MPPYAQPPRLEILALWSGLFTAAMSKSPGRKNEGFSYHPPHFGPKNEQKPPNSKMGKSPWLKVKMGPNLENVGLCMCKWSKCNGRHRDCLTLDV